MINNMSVLLIRVRTVWDDYFPGSSPSQTFETTKYTTVQSTSSTNVFVLNCLFIGCTSTSYGGALACSGSVQRLLVESSSFFSCSTSSDYGGAIYFWNTNTGECVLNKVCGNDCISTYTSSSGGQVVFTYVKDSSSNKNYVNYSSFTRCINERKGSYYMVDLINGKICCPSVNSSMNKCQYHSGIFCDAFAVSNTVTCSLSYSTIADNHAFGYTCIYFCRSTSKHEIKCCNILRNTQSPNTLGTIYINGNLMIEDSCILENNATYNFYASSSSTITVSNCTIDSDSYYGSFNKQITITKSFINALNHVSTQNCASEYDSVGTLAVITPMKKKEFCHTCNRLQCYCSSLTYIFMFTFIHPNPSGDLR
jgi:hypothetical protein